MKVCKFGGTSVASAEQIRKVVDIVTSDPERKIVVVSAPGKRFSDDIKVTDLLIRLAEAALLGEETESHLKRVVDRFRDIAEELGLSNDVPNAIEKDLRSRLAYDKNDPLLYMDMMKAAGEDNNAKMIAAYFSLIGMEAKYVSPKEGGLLVNDRPHAVRALPEGDEKLAKLRDESALIVFPGFFGYTKDGTLRTFNRGGSDITGSIVAAAVEAELYENFTDVDSVFAANPTVIENPVPIQTMTYREMRELAYAGFSVFHDEALIPAFRKSIPVSIKNTNNPQAPGTSIVKERDYHEQQVIGIAADSGFTAIYVDKYLMNTEIGFGRRLLQIFEEEDISYEHTPSGIDNISIIIRTSYFTKDKEERIVKRIHQELNPDAVIVEHDYSMIVLVGEGMQYTTGLAARAATAIARSGANIEMINQGSSEVSLVFGVKVQDEDRILKALYAEFFQTASVHS